MTARCLGALLVALVGLVGAAKAQDRPSENDMFGAPPPASEPASAPATATTPATSTATAPATATATATTTKSEGDSRDQLNMGAPEAATRFSAEVAPEDPLKIGGQIYLRAQSSAQQGQSAGNWTLSSPSLLDAYMDVRPNDRVRGFVLARTIFDPTLPATASTSLSTISGGSQNFSTGGAANLSSLFGAQATRTPRVLLDQMWLRFDIKHTVFVTAGRQHVRWGTARFWTPTDFLHIQHRNPLDVFDARTGTTMIKVHVPWEAQGWNFYAYGLAEGADATPTASSVAGAARAEMVWSSAELGLGGVVQRGHKPKLAADLSAGIWDLDFYGEVALRFGQDIDRVRFDSSAVPLTLDPLPTGTVDQTALAQYLGPAVDNLYPVAPGSGVKPQATGGVSYSLKYAANDVFTVGAEYFYNGLGYSDTAVYPGLILPHSQLLREPATFFYLGRHYAALFATAPAPYSWDNTTFTLSNLANLSDRSGITRLDYSLILLTHLRFEAFGAVHWGNRNGEFRFGMDTTTLGQYPNPVTGQMVPFQIPGRSPGLFDLGVGLRVSI
ncbi:MAG: hypothetical protein WCG85_11780 [Polyangia bacterium]